MARGDIQAQLEELIACFNDEEEEAALYRKDPIAYMVDLEGFEARKKARREAKEARKESQKQRMSEMANVREESFTIKDIVIFTRLQQISRIKFTIETGEGKDVPVNLDLSSNFAFRYSSAIYEINRMLGMLLEDQKS